MRCMSRIRLFLVARNFSSYVISKLQLLLLRIEGLKCKTLCWNCEKTSAIGSLSWGPCNYLFWLMVMSMCCKKVSSYVRTARRYESKRTGWGACIIIHYYLPVVHKKWGCQLDVSGNWKEDSTAGGKGDHNGTARNPHRADISAGRQSWRVICFFNPLLFSASGASKSECTCHTQ